MWLEEVVTGYLVSGVALLLDPNVSCFLLPRSSALMICLTLGPVDVRPLKP